MTDDGPGGDSGEPTPARRNLISSDSLRRLWRLAEDRERLSPAERALLVLALGELSWRRELVLDSSEDGR